MITGVWKGKINRQKVEVKIVQKGDSLMGTSYYYESPSHYRRYAIKGYFNQQTNEVVWWDDRLIEEKSGRLNLSSPGKIPLLSSADFNCPGNGTMMLDGKAVRKEDNSRPGDLHLEKVPDPAFEDEWDYVIDNFLSGTNDPYIIDSIGTLTQNIPVYQPPLPGTTKEPVVLAPPPVQPVPVTKVPEEKKPVILAPPPAPLTIEEKFVTREKKLTLEIPLAGDSIEFRFYDNAEIDGDSISLFLNGKLYFSHIRLTGKAYTIKLAIADLPDTSELIMVAENLGSIPPNTSYMYALVGDKRYEARLESTEGSSAMIRMVKGQQ